MPVRKIVLWLLGLAALALSGNVLWVLWRQGLANAEDLGLALFYCALAMLVWLFCLLGPRLALGGRAVLKGLLLIVSLGVSLVLFELLMTPFHLVFNSANQATLHEPQAVKRHVGDKYRFDLEVDPELGYVPRRGGQYAYDRHGAQRNAHQARTPPGVRRVALVGDSIAAIGYLGGWLERLGPPGVEYWNLGVDGFGAWQELKYFERHGRALRPDLVLIEFCLNDFDGTPVILKDQDGQAVVANLYLGSEQFNPWLYRRSTIYRAYLSLKASLTDRDGLRADVKNTLAAFQRHAVADRFKLKVVVYPLMSPYEQWPESYKKQRQEILAILRELGVEHFDASDLLAQALQSRPLAWARMAEGDYFHPSEAFAELLARRLLAAGFLATER